jgi:hypothetical protein
MGAESCRCAQEGCQHAAWSKELKIATASFPMEKGGRCACLPTLIYFRFDHNLLCYSRPFINSKLSRFASYYICTTSQSFNMLIA